MLFRLRFFRKLHGMHDNIGEHDDAFHEVAETRIRQDWSGDQESSHCNHIKECSGHNLVSADRLYQDQKCDDQP